MKKIHEKANTRYLNEKLKDLKWLSDGTEQDNHHIESLENCIENKEERQQLIKEWNNLIDQLEETKNKAKNLNWYFGETFKEF